MPNWTKSRDLDMSGPAKTCLGGQVLTVNQRIFLFIFGDFGGYFGESWSNIKVFNSSNLIFELLQQK